MASITRRSSTFSPTLAKKLSTLEIQQDGPTVEDYDRAESLMQKQRADAGNGKSGRFGHKEATPVLSKVANGLVPDANLGLVQALLAYGASVCFARSRSSNLFKVIAGKNQMDVRSNLLEQATRNCSQHILFELSMYADEEAVGQALPIAIAMGDAIKISILLARGGDVSPYCELFLQVVDTGSDDVLGLLLGEINGACRECKDKGLVRAAAAGNMAKTEMLMNAGADLSYNNAAAIIAAIQSGHEDIAMVMVSRPEMKGHPLLLSHVAGQANQLGQYRLQNACQSPACVQEQKSYSKSIPGPRASPAFGAERTPALVGAVKAGSLNVVEQLLLGQTPQGVLDMALGQAVKLPEAAVALQMTSLLLASGLRGGAVADALVYTLQREMPESQAGRLKMVHILLVDGQADVNMHNGAAIMQAIRREEFNILRLLLEHDPSIATLELALEASMKKANQDVRLALVNLLIEAGKIAHDEGLQRVTVAAASRNLALDVLQSIAKFITSPAIFSMGFSALTQMDDQWLSPQGLCVVSFLLDCGAFGPDIDRAMCRAAVKHDRDAVELLSTSVQATSLDMILSSVIVESPDWQLPGNIWLVQSLLELGCKGQSINQALIRAISTYVKGRDSGILVDILLARADVNYQEGEALQIAARSGHAPLLERLCSSAGRVALTRAFHAAITAEIEADKTLTVINVLFTSDERARTGVDIHATLADRRSPVVACLSAHPRSAVLLGRLIELGCDVQSKVCTKLDTGDESVPVLVWALSRCGSRELAPDVIGTLINATPETINYTASKMRLTPLMIAAQHGLGGAVSKLLAANANTVVRDSLGRTPLFFASQTGNLEIVKSLLKVKFRRDDGSLHEAARNLHSEVVEVLIKAKHDINYPCSLHAGRGALHELCFKGDGSKDTLRLEDTMLALAKADVLVSWDGRNSLFLALENPQPYPVTKALLDLVMWRHINDENNVFEHVDPETRITFVLSATSYLTRGVYRGDVANIPQLQKLLYEKRCVDRFYAKYGPSQLEEIQPAHAVGMPPKIAEEDTRRRAEQEKRRNRGRDHWERLQRDQQEADQKYVIEQRLHEQRLEWKMSNRGAKAKVDAQSSQLEPASPTQKPRHSVQVYSAR